MGLVRRRRRWFSHAAACLLLVLLRAPASKAQISGAPVTPGRVTLTLRLGDGQAQFHRGEVIPVELTFGSHENRSYSVPEDCMPHGYYIYKVPPQFVDRRIEIDAGMGMAEDVGAGCHGAHWDMDLGATPLEVFQLLNERFRMDQPGKYQIAVTSGRLGFPITSNWVDLEILPDDPKWDEAELNRAIAMLGSTVGSKEWETGCQVIRFLGTEAAELEMARHFASRSCRNYDFALINTTHRSLVRAELEKELADPNSVITFTYLRTLAILSLYDQHPDWYPDANVSSEGAADPWERSKLWWQRTAAPAEEIRYARQLAAVLPVKSRQARALCAETLLDLGRQMYGFDVPEDLRLSVVRDVPSILVDLPDMERGHELAGQDWEQIKGPAMVPILKDLVEDKHWLGPYSLALRRLYELAPDEARPVFLSEMSLAYPQGDLATLSLLPDKELPQLDGAMLQRVQALYGDGYLEYSAGLLQRYASPAIADQLRPWFEERLGKMWCGAEANLIAYFLRVSPTEGATMLRKAMLTDKAGCDLLRRLALVRMSPEVGDAALAALNDARPEINEEALQVLQCYGSATSKEPLFDHFRQWHASWVNRAQELESSGWTGQARVETAYVNALGVARAWLATETERQALIDLCVTSNCRQNAMRTVRAAATPGQTVMFGFRESTRPEFSEEFSLGSPCSGTDLEGLENKMAQYAKGTVFQMDARDKQSYQVKRVYDQLEPWTSSHGYKLHVYREGMSQTDCIDFEFLHDGRCWQMPSQPKQQRPR
jgi:hypothetical protein